MSAMQEQFRFLDEVQGTVTLAHETIEEIRTIRKQSRQFLQLVPKDSSYQALRKECLMIDSLITNLEEQLYQTRNESSQDPLNFPIRLTNKLAHLNNVVREGPYAPTNQAWAVKNELEQEINAIIQQWQAIKSDSLPALNASIRDAALDVIRLPQNQD